MSTPQEPLPTFQDKAADILCTYVQGPTLAMAMELLDEQADQAEAAGLRPDELAHSIMAELGI